MALVTCPACGAQTSDLSSHCPECNQALPPSVVAPIKKVSGKLTALGVVIIAVAVIGTALGTWWGPAALLPGIAFYMMSKFL
ncbi:MAG: hypothetical protein ACKN9W_07115 [Methylococcus sp.]